MKIALTLIICSALSQTCDPPFKTNMTFDNWHDCMRQGFIDGLQLMDVMGEQYINQNKTIIKFRCKPIPKPKELGT